MSKNLSLYNLRARNQLLKINSKLQLFLKSNNFLFIKFFKISFMLLIVVFKKRLLNGKSVIKINKY